MLRIAAARITQIGWWIVKLTSLLLAAELCIVGLYIY